MESFSSDSEAHLQQELAGEEANSCKVLAAAMDSSGMTGCGSCIIEPNFRIDDLLDFPTELEDELLGDASPGLFMNAPVPLHDSAHAKFEESSSSSAVDDESSYGLCVPPDELVHQLEWLSSLNEDYCFIGGDTKGPSSVSSCSRASSGGVTRSVKEGSITTSRKPRESFNSRSPISVLEQGTHSGYIRINHVYKSHRVRKARSGGRVWSLDILKPIRVDNRIKNSYESASLLVTSSSSVYSEPLCSFLNQDVLERPSKKMKQAIADVADPGLVRRCSHCLVQKTPQWRAGPQGPKTLCNACGVRYKSGRLVPEYRPAASPSFVNEVHSNSHRRILEMRRAKEVEVCVEIHGIKVERGEETIGSEDEGGSHVSAQGDHKKSMDMHEFKGQHWSVNGPTEFLPCKEVEAGGDYHSDTAGASDQDALREASGSWGEDTTSTDDVIDSLPRKELSCVLINTTAYNIEVMRQG